MYYDVKGNIMIMIVIISLSFIIIYSCQAIRMEFMMLGYGRDGIPLGHREHVAGNFIGRLFISFIEADLIKLKSYK